MDIIVDQATQTLRNSALSLEVSVLDVSFLPHLATMLSYLQDLHVDLLNQILDRGSWFILMWHLICMFQELINEKGASGSECSAVEITDFLTAMQTMFHQELRMKVRIERSLF
jgi:hypothetical protein